MLSSTGAIAQDGALAPPQTADSAPAQQSSATLSNGKKVRKSKEQQRDEKVTQSKDTKQQLRKERKMAPVDAKLPDKILYDKAIDSTKHGHYDVARLNLQTLLSTYPDSQYQMRAKLAIADSWYKEGGSAPLAQAESEFRDFITFFPNVPEAAEAQMRIGDIYFRQMDKPDRDYDKAVHAEQEYRLMLQQFPDSPLIPQAKQRLREVQEVLATREADIAAFYASRGDAMTAAIARYQTVVDTYPQYSHMDDVLVGLGDLYEQESKYVHSANLSEDAKARLQKIYDDKAVAAYSKVILEHSASPHVEDARERLEAMSAPIPTPTPEQVAASIALENSRRQYRLQDRATLMILHRPDTILAARDGEPPLTDPAITTAPHVSRAIVDDFKSALNPASSPAATTAATPAATPTESAAPATAAAAPAAPAKPLQFEDVPTSTGGSSTGAVITSVPGSSSGAAVAPTPGSNSMGVEILTPGANGSSTAAPATPALSPADKANIDALGLKPVVTANTPLPAAEKPETAPDTVNDVRPGDQPPAQASNPNSKKKPKVAYDKEEESSSKHPKKKGLNKLNPF